MSAERERFTRALATALDDLGVTVDSRKVDALAHRIAELLTDELAVCPSCEGSRIWQFQFGGDDAPVVSEPCGVCSSVTP